MAVIIVIISDLWPPFFYFPELRKVTIISDSIAKYVTGIDGCTVQSFRGDTIARLTSRMLSGQAILEHFDFVIIHVGTNDIGNRATFNNIISDFGNLIGVCRKINPLINIIISAILPRPVDNDITDTVIRKVNSHLHKFMSKDMNFKFICTYKPFTFGGRIKVELFAKKDGGLHLNTEGTNRLKHFFLRVISTL